MKNILSKLAPDAQDRRELQHLGNAAKFGVKCAATAVLIFVVLCAATSFCGLFAAPHIAEDGMTFIWGKP